MIDVNKSMQQRDGMDIQTYNETHAKAIHGLEEEVKKIMNNERVSLPTTDAPIFTIEGRTSPDEPFVSGYARAHVSAVDGFEEALDDVLSEEIIQITDFNAFNPTTLDIEVGEVARIMAIAGASNGPWAVNQGVAGTITRTNHIGEQYHLNIKRGNIAPRNTPIEANRAWASGAGWGNWDTVLTSWGTIERSRMTESRMISNWNSFNELWFADNPGTIIPFQNGATVQNGPFGNSRSLGMFFNEGSWNNGEGMLMVYGLGLSQQASNYLAIRQIRQGNFAPWRYLVSTTTFNAPINPETGEEMDVYEAHDYNLNKITKLETDLELYKDFIEFKFGDEFETFKAAK